MRLVGKSFDLYISEIENRFLMVNIPFYLKYSLGKVSLQCTNLGTKIDVGSYNYSYSFYQVRCAFQRYFTSGKQ